MAGTRGNSSPRGNALIGQSGGPTSVINQSLVGLVEGCAETDRIEQVFGALHGIRGLMDENLVDLGRETQATLDGIAQTPAAALRSVRHKPSEADCARALDVLQAHNVRYFFYIGGNDTSETADILNRMALAEGYELRLFHVPKTIDNDLMVTDHCPGYGSAARFVSSALIGDNLDNRSLPGVKVDVIMGRHAGWLTASSALARVHEDDGPHLIYLPETEFEMDAFLGDVERVYTERGRCVIAVSEGVHDAQGKTILNTQECDAHGNVQLSGNGALGDFLASKIKGAMGQKLRVRADTFGYLQRGFPGVVSDVDALEAREVGRFVVRQATQEDRPHGSAVLLRRPGKDYGIDYGITELENVAAKTKVMPPEFIAGSNDVTSAFIDYVRPLVGRLPINVRLSDFSVPTRLPAQ